MFLLPNLNDFLQRNFCKEINELRTNIMNDMGKETRFTRCLVGYEWQGYILIYCQISAIF